MNQKILIIFIITLFSCMVLLSCENNENNNQIVDSTMVTDNVLTTEQTGYDETIDEENTTFDETEAELIIETSVSETTATLCSVHEFSDWNTIRESTCSKNGVQERYCTICNFRETEKLPLTEHVVIEDYSYPADCTSQGLKGKTYCSVCGKTISKSEKIPALGHLVVIDPAVAATYTESGLTQGTHCSRCGEVITEQTIVPPKCEQDFDCVKYLGQITKFKNKNFTGELVVPEKIDGIEIKSIAMNAFDGCTGITSLVLPESLESLDKSSLAGLYNLQSITLPFIGGVKNATSYYYYFGYPFGANDVNENSKYLPSSLRKVVFTGDRIPDKAFYGISQITDLEFKKQIYYCGNSAFSYCTGIRNIYISDIHSWLNGSLGVSSFVSCEKDKLSFYCSGTKMSSFIIPNSFTKIERNNFTGCGGITSVTIPNSVTSIGNNAFLGCSGLTSITIPSSVTSIGNSAFSGCKGLTSLTIPDSVTSIGSGAFYGCTGLTSLTIPDSVTSIGNMAFLDCTGIVNLKVPGDFLYNIGFNKKNIRKVVITGDLKTINEYTFSDSTLEEISLPSSVEIIGDNAFYRCFIKEISLPSVKMIGSHAFAECQCLEKVELGSYLTVIPYRAFYNCSRVEHFIIPDSVTKIAEQAFMSNVIYGEQRYTIPESATDISGLAFNPGATLYVKKGSFADSRFTNSTFNGKKYNVIYY